MVTVHVDCVFSKNRHFIKIVIYIKNSYLIDVHSSKYRTAFFDMHDFHTILPGDSINIIEQFFYAFIDVL